MSLPQCCGEKIRNVVILKAQVSDVNAYSKIRHLGFVDNQNPKFKFE